MTASQETGNAGNEEIISATANDSDTGDTNAPNTEDIEAIKKRGSESANEAKYLQEVRKVLKDNTYLETLARNDRQKAERVAREEWGISLNEALDQLKSYQTGQSETRNASATSENDFDKWYEERKAKEEAQTLEKKSQEAYSETITNLGLEEGSEKYDALVKEYSFLAEGKKLTPDAVKKLLKTAFRNINSDDVEEVTNQRKVVDTVVSRSKGSGEQAQESEPDWTGRDSGPKSWY